MEHSLASIIETMVNEIKKELFSPTKCFHELVATSPYDTAWLAMIPDPSNLDRPLFKTCLNWILENQKDEGFWGEYDGLCPAIDTLPATLACLVALKKWNVGQDNINKGLAFFNANVDLILIENANRLPLWFTTVFPAMIELAQSTAGLHLTFVNEPNGLLSNVFLKRKQFFEREKLVDELGQCSPIFAYLECFPNTIIEDVEHKIYEHLCNNGDGSFFQSPSATSYLYMSNTANTKTLNYLKYLVQKFPNGVPARYPVDEELIKLCIIDHIQRLGLAEHFTQNIEQTLSQIYRDQQMTEMPPTEMLNLDQKLFKDSLAFRLLRMQGHEMSPRKFCWFLEHENIKVHLEENHEYFTSVLYNIYRATDLIFPGENEMEQARSFSRNLLQKSLADRNNCDDDNSSQFPQLLNLIEHEVKTPWFARMDRLDNRLWIENKFNPFSFIGVKASYYRLSHLQNKRLTQLAMDDFESRQSTYRNEIEELKRWSKEKGLVDIGFGREKTTYLYFSLASSTCLPHDSIIRMICAKSAIVITVADDFYDMEGSLTDLQLLTDAVQRWNGENLFGPSKTIFGALEDVVKEIGTMYYLQHGSDITAKLRHLWKETFDSWMTESTWSQTGYKPTMGKYLETATTSIAADIVVLPGACFLTPGFPVENLNPLYYEDVTKLLMSITRLLNEVQSYEKEIKDGKMNYVMLHLNEHPEGSMEDSIAHVNDIIDSKKKEFLKLVLTTSKTDNDHHHHHHELMTMSKACKHFHLHCLKVFNMFYNSYNLFDTKADLIQDIMKAIYVPFERNQLPQAEQPVKVKKPQTVLKPIERSGQSQSQSQREKVSASLGPTNPTRKYHNKFGISYIGKQVSKNNSSLGYYYPNPFTIAKNNKLFNLISK